MKNAYYFPALAALLAAAPTARAQQAWQPFRANVVYQYTETTTPGDTTHTLQIGAGAAVAGSPDTLYRFNRRAPKANVQRFQSGSSNNYQLVADNLFGATLRVRPGAVFVLTAANGRSLTLRPRAPLGQNWAAGPAGLTAHVMSRSVAQVLGQPDSVAWFMLSDGQNIRLSKRFGLIEGPSVDSYLNGRNRRRGLVLTAFSAAGRVVGPLVVGARAAFDFQPGDVFQRRGTDGYNWGTCSETWTQDSILTRTPSRNGDSLTYTLRRREVERAYGVPGAPAGFCGASGSTYTATNVTLLVMPTTANNRVITMLTNAFTILNLNGPSSAFGQIAGPAVRNARYLRRPEWEQQVGGMVNGLTADSTRLQTPVDYGTLARHAVGLGATRTINVSYNQTTDVALVAYRKGPEIWGTFFSFPQLLATRANRPAATTAAYPQPFGSNLTVKLDLARPQPVALALHDGLGRTVLARPAAALAAGTQQVVLSTQNLPAGVYMLHIGLPAEGRSEVLKVLKGE